MTSYGVSIAFLNGSLSECSRNSPKLERSHLRAYHFVTDLLILILNGFWEFSQSYKPERVEEINQSLNYHNFKSDSLLLSLII